MVITKIESQKNENRVNVYIDGSFAFGIMKEVQYKHNLLEGMKIDKEYIQEVLLGEEQVKCNNFALGYLGYRQRSENEIIKRLQRKGFEQDIIENTLDYLRNYDLIDDLEFARSFAKDKIKINKYGPKKIKYELFKKGVSQAIIDQVLNDDDTEYARALELAKKKLISYRNDTNSAQYRKLGGFLQRKGYSTQYVYKILDELIK